MGDRDHGSHAIITGQATETVSSSDGTKVTSDPQTGNDPKNENPGMVTSDSLAAESIEEGGSFGANSDSRGPMSQPSRSVNTATTDISGATRLEPAPDAEARLASEEWNEASKLQSNLGSTTGANLGSSASGGAPAGVEPYNTAAAPSSGTASTGGVTDTTNSQSMPKGKNITEGGFDPNAPNASNNTDIGSRRDPGRVALQGFEEDNVPSAGGAGPRQGEVTNDGQYDILKETSA